MIDLRLQASIVRGRHVWDVLMNGRLKVSTYSDDIVGNRTLIVLPLPVYRHLQHYIETTQTHPSGFTFIQYKSVPVIFSELWSGYKAIYDRLY